MKKVVLASILWLVGTAAIFSQSNSIGSPYISIPERNGAIFLLRQPDSPLIFEELELLTDENGAFPQLHAVLRNKTKKSVSAFTFEFHHSSTVRKWSSSPESWVHKVGDESKLIELIPADGAYENIRLNSSFRRPWSVELQKMLQGDSSSSRLFTLWVGFVRSVRFTDGTSYVSNLTDSDVDDLLRYRSCL